MRLNFLRVLSFLMIFFSMIVPGVLFSEKFPYSRYYKPFF